MAVYTTIDDPSAYFNPKLYTGNNSTQSITGVGFQPDMVWIKKRDATSNHCVMDAVRGATWVLKPNITEASVDEDGLTSFDSDGFSLTNYVNTNSSNTFVAWNWKANGTGSANTEGDIDTTISANTTSGFSIIGGCDDLSDGDTFGHGLDSAPNMVWLKRTDSASGWRVFYTGITSGSTLFLNATDAVASDNDCIDSVSSTLITIKGSGTGGTEGDNENVAYAWQSVQGYSKIGSYTGNGNADGTFVYTGFRPAFFLFKKSSAAGNNWGLFDNKRNTFNLVDTGLKPDANEAEYTTNGCDFLSNGVKMRSTGGDNNTDGATYIYMAFAESPFVNSEGVPTNAR